MNTFLRAKRGLVGLNKKAVNPKAWILTGIIMLVSLLSANSAFAAFGFAGGSYSPATTTIQTVCALSGSTGTATLQFTGTDCTIGATDWTASYYWEASTNNFATAGTTITGASGTFSHSSPTVTLTPTLTVTASCSTMYYRLQVTGISNPCISIGGTSFTSNTWQVKFCPSPGPITGGTSVCVGTPLSLSNSVAGGTWVSSVTSKATIGSATGVVTGVAPGTTTISYTLSSGCFVTQVVTVNSAAPTFTAPPYICLGDTDFMTLSIPTAGTYSSSDVGKVWFFDSLTRKGYAIGVSLGTATVTYTALNGCYSTMVVTVEPLPTSVSPMDTVVCSGATFTYTGTPAGGTWDSEDPTVIIILSSGAANAVSSYTFAATTRPVYHSIYGCKLKTNVTVNPVPATLTGTVNICVGTCGSLSTTSTGGSWSISNPAVGTIDPVTGLICGLSAGTARVTYSFPTGCAIYNKIVTVNANPSALTGPSTVCVGSTITVASSGGSYSSSNTAIATVAPFGPNGVVTGVSEGTVTISYTIAGSGCFVTKTVTVLARPAPIGGPTAVCSGSTITLTNDSTVTWSSSNAAVASIGSSTGIVLGGTSGTATIIATLVSTGCSRSITVTVNALPTITGTLAVCVNSTITPTGSPGGGTWMSVTPTIATVGSSSGVISGVAAGLDSVYYTSPLGCVKGGQVTVNPLPTVSGSPTVCVTGTTTLTSTGGAGSWSTSSSAIASVGTSGIVTGVSGGTVTITFSLTATGCKAIWAMTVNSASTPITGTSSLCVGQTVSLSNATAGGTWSSTNTGVATIDPFGYVLGMGAGTSTIVYTLPTGCAATQVVTVNALPSSITPTTIVCVGSTSSLSSVPTGGTWSSSNTLVGTVGSTTGVFVGIAPGTTTIMYTSPAGCSVTQDITVNITPGAISGPSSLCAGTVATYTSTPTGGTWSSSNLSLVTIGSSTGIATAGTPAVASTVTITYTLPGSCIATKVITINPLPASITGTLSVCVGACSSLADATAGGTWSSSSFGVASVGSATGVACGVTPGTATITYTSAAGCTATAVMTVNATPTSITGTATVCAAGGTTSLAGLPSGGTWSSSAGTGTISIGSSSGVVTGTTAGTATVTYTLAGGCFITTVVTVNATPTAITGNLTICVGSTSSLASTPAGGTWTSSATGIATINSSGVVTGVAVGTSVISYTLSTNCYATAIVSVSTAPAAILGTLNVCVGSTVNYTHPTPGGTWSSSNLAVGTIGSTTGIFVGLSAGTSNISYILPGGCFTVSTVTVNAAPASITGATSVCVGSNITLATTTGGVTWSTTPGTGSVVVGASTGIVTGVSAGTATITVTGAAGCFTTTTVTINPVPNISGTLTLCVGSTTTLSTTAGGATWSSTSGIISVGGTTGVITGLSGGTATVTLTITATGCRTIATVTVNASPTITGTFSTCVGSSTTLTGTPAGGTWSTGCSNIAVLPSGVVFGLSVTSPGTPCLVTYTNGAGCSSTAAITVNPLPGTITASPSANVCVGNTITLTDPTSGGTWVSGSTGVAIVGSSSGIVTGVSAGTAIITYKLTATGCIATIVITVNPLLPSITGSHSICQGQTTTLANTTSGGVWTSGTTTVATIGSSSGIVTGIAAGTTVITYTIPSTLCTATFIVTVNPLPDTIAGPSSVCLGSTIGLTDAIAGGTWSSTVTTVGTVGSTSGIVTGVGTGTTTIIYTLATGCSIGKVITVNPLPLSISGGTNVCQFDSITLTNATAGGGTWTSSATGVATVGLTTGVVTGVSGGTATITFTATATGCITTTVISVDLSPAVITGSLSICQGDSSLLSSSPAGGIWTSQFPFIASVDVFTGMVHGLFPGTSTITYTLPTGCHAMAVVTVNPLPSAIGGSASVCSNSSITLSSAPTGGVWSVSSGSGSASIVPTAGILTGGTPGTVTVTYTLPTGCYITTVITVQPLPTAITGSANICFGDSTTLSSTPTGGTWSSSNTLIATVGSSSGVVVSNTGGSPGTVTITYTSPAGCVTTRVVTVNPIPPAITGTFVICQGMTTTLADVTTGGTWVSSNLAVATVGSASGVVTGILGFGTTTITYTLPTGCYTTAVVTVNPLPTPITGVMQVCNGLTTTLSTTTVGGTWSETDLSGSATITSLGTSVAVTGTSPGAVGITYTLATGCIRTAIVIVNPLPTPIDGIKTVCVGQTTLLSDTLTGGTWFSTTSSVATIGLTTGIVTGISAGTSLITYTLPTGCIMTTIVTVYPLPAPIVGASTVCAGGFTTTMTDATTGGTWSSSVTAVADIDSTTGIVTGHTAGTTTITYKLTATGCYVTKIITINPLPPGITGFSQLCHGYTSTLYETITGGTWSSSNPLVITVTPIVATNDTALVTGVSPGTSAITFTLPTGCYTTFIMTVHPLPAPIIDTNGSRVCVNDSLFLTDATTPGTWSSSNVTKAIIDPVTGKVTGVSAGTAIITYTLGTGCYVTKVITINPLPRVILGTPDICVGFTRVLTDSTAGGTWISGNTTVATIAATGTYTGLVTGVSAGTSLITYKLTATGCYVTVLFNVHPIPNVTVTHPSMICRHASVMLTASGADSAGTGTYTWAPPTGLSCTNCPNPIASPTITTTYTVTGTTIYGCFDTAVVTVNVDSILSHLSISGKDSVCRGSCTTLIAEGFPPGSLFAWTPAVGLNCTICDTVVACPDITRQYWAIAIDSFGCKDSATITMHVMDLPKMYFSPNPATVCYGGSTQLRVVDTLNSGTTFAWFPNIFLSCDSCATPVASDTQNLVYRVIGTTPFGCYDSIKVPVSVLRDATYEVSPDTVICIGQYVQLWALVHNPDGSTSGYYWTPANTLNNGNIWNPIATPSLTTTYQLIMVHNRCFSDTATVTVGVVPYPDVRVTPHDTTVVAGSPIPLTATVVNNVLIKSYAWSPTNTLSCEHCYNTIATPTFTTTYSFVAVSSYGCESIDTVRITTMCDQSQVFIPNTFTPNGDGVNDRFYISGKGLTKITRFQVFNRWGELVFETNNVPPNDPAYGWDGTYKGLVVPPDVFVYVVEAICELGAPLKYTGDISIVR